MIPDDGHLDVDPPTPDPDPTNRSSMEETAARPLLAKRAVSADCLLPMRLVALPHGQVVYRCQRRSIVPWRRCGLHEVDAVLADQEAWNAYVWAHDFPPFWRTDGLPSAQERKRAMLRSGTRHVVLGHARGGVTAQVSLTFQVPDDWRRAWDRDVQQIAARVRAARDQVLDAGLEALLKEERRDDEP